jgi:hypothetical protein
MNSKSVSYCEIVERYELDNHNTDRHEVIVVNQIDIVERLVDQVNNYVPESLAVVGICVLVGQPSSNLLEGVLVLADLKSQITGSVLDFLREVLCKHVIDFDYESKCYK